MRYAWDQFDAYFGSGRVGPAANRAAAPRAGSVWRGGTRPPPAAPTDMWLSLSTLPAGSVGTIIVTRRSFIRQWIRSFTVRIRPAPEAFLLIVSALVPYKRIDLAIEAAPVAGMPLRVAGAGPERDRLQALAAEPRCGRRVPRAAARRGDPRALSARRGGSDARRRRFRHRAGRGAGMRQAGGGAGARRRSGNRRGRSDRRAGG